MTSNNIEIMNPEVQIQDNNSTQEFSRSVIDSMNKQVKLVDSDNGLDLFCYIRCESTDSDILKKCRGVVFNKETVVMNGFPYTYEYTEDNADIISKSIGPIFSDCSFYNSHEGALIRLFYFGDKWYMSTNRKLDANKSKWSSKESFGLFFRQALDNEIKINEKLRASLPDDESIDNLEKFQAILDKEKQYMFLLLNNDQNRIVCSPSDKYNFFHVGTFIDGNLSMNEDINIPYPEKFNFQNLDDLFEYVNGVDIYRLQGIIVFAPNNFQYKIFNKEYFDLYKVRGNEPSLKFRYLQIRMNKRFNNLLNYLYPTFSPIFEEYENNIYGIGKLIHKAYIERFIKNQYVTVPMEEFAVIKACHDWHMKDREKNKISLNKVMEVLNEQTPTNINKMIRRFYIDKQNAEKKETEGIKDDTVNFPSIQIDKKQTRYKPLMDRTKIRKNNSIKVPSSEVVEINEEKVPSSEVVEINEEKVPSSEVVELNDVDVPSSEVAELNSVKIVHPFSDEIFEESSQVDV